MKDETGNTFNQVLTVTDRGSKQVILIPCWWKDKAPVVACQILHEGVRHIELPSSIASDRDTKFTSVFWRSLCHLMEVKARMTSPFHAQANGAAERTNHTMNAGLGDSCSGEAKAAECGAYTQLVENVGRGRDRHQQRTNCEHGIESLLPEPRISHSFLVRCSEFRRGQIGR